jgi:hypothetical protein
MKTWVKLYTEINHDPAVGRLTWAQRGLLSALLALAGEIDHRDAAGHETGALDTVANTAWRLRCSQEELRELMGAWGEGSHLVEREGVLVLVGYPERQRRPHSETAEGVNERVRRHRAAQRAGKGDVTGAQRSVTAPEAESEAEADSGSDTDTDPRRAGAAAAVAGADPPIGEGAGEAQEGKDGERQEVLACLHAGFTRLTGIDPPNPHTLPARREAHDKWTAPIQRIAAIAGWDAAAGESLMARAVDHLWSKGCTVTCPRSIADTALALAGEVARKRAARRRDREIGERMAAYRQGLR